MDKIIKIEDCLYQYLTIGNELYSYELYSSAIRKNFNIERLLSDDDYFNKTLKVGYKYYEVTFWKGTMNKRFFIPLNRNFIEYYSQYWSDKNLDKTNITLSNIDIINHVDSFYEFSLEIEINGLRTEFIQSLDDKNLLYIDRPYNDKKTETKMAAILGEPQIPSDIGYDKGGPFYYYILPKSRIDKVIGIKRYRKISSFGSYEGEDFTGEEEEFILDLHNFNEDIYKVFKEHEMLEIER